MATKIHVLLVEHESKDHDKTMNMLQYFSYEVTSVKLASTALSILSKEKLQFDLVMVNINSPDSFGFQLLQVAIKMNLLVILMSNDDDAPTIMRALEQGAYFCMKKPVTMQMLGQLWQLVLREKLCRLNEKGPLTKVIEYNPQAKEFGEKDFAKGSKNNNNDDEEKHTSKKKINSGTSEQGNVVFKRKIWTEWTGELHGKFMDAVKELGQGRCYPKDILELMNVPGLTRMQVASHLQKCRNAKWLPPNERKLSKQANNVETIPLDNKRPRSKTVRFGSMPFVDDNSKFHLRIQEHHETNHQEFTTFDPSTETIVLGHNHVGSPNDGSHPRHLLDYGINTLSEDNGTLINIGQVGDTYGIMDELFVYGGENVTPVTNISSNHITEDDAFELPIMDSLMVQNFSDFEQELGGNGNLQSLVLEQEDNHHQISIVTNATDQWIHEALKPMDMQCKN